MRIEVENNNMRLSEFVASLGKVNEPIELTQHGAVVATVAKTATIRSGSRARKDADLDKLTARGPKFLSDVKTNVKRKSKSEAAVARGWQVFDEARANAKKYAPKKTESQVIKEVNAALDEVRRGHAQRRLR